MPVRRSPDCLLQGDFGCYRRGVTQEGRARRLAGEGTSFAGKAFIKSYIGVCMEGAVIVLACLIFSAFMSGNTPVLDTSLSAVTMSWQYVAETIFNMMVLVGLVKGVERIVREIFGLS